MTPDQLNNEYSAKCISCINTWSLAVDDGQVVKSQSETEITNQADDPILISNLSRLFSLCLGADHLLACSCSITSQNLSSYPLIGHIAFRLAIRGLGT